MSIYLSGATFADQRVSPADDGAVFAAALSDGRAAGCLFSRVGSTLRMTAGKLIACGRVVRVASALDIPVTDASSGYARLVLTLDLSKTATTSAFEQAALDVQYAQTVGAFASLTQEDINNGGTVYQVALCLMELGTSGITSILWTCGKAHGKATGINVTLTASGWSNDSQTVRCDGVKADTNVVATFAPASRDAYLGAGVYLSAQGEGTLTFSCDSAPAETVTANILLL